MKSLKTDFDHLSYNNNTVYFQCVVDLLAENVRKKVHHIFEILINTVISIVC
jgi:hypothetical protein